MLKDNPGRKTQKLTACCHSSNMSHSKRDVGVSLWTKGWFARKIYSPFFIGQYSPNDWVAWSAEGVEAMNYKPENTTTKLTTSQIFNDFIFA